jgi:hypothetical protein
MIELGRQPCYAVLGSDALWLVTESRVAVGQAPLTGWRSVSVVRPPVRKARP